MADFRFPLDADDYIIDEWTFVDLTSLGAVKGLEFVLTSTDTTGGFGMNNPAYFAAENFEVSLGVEENEISELEVYPNPTTGLVKIQTQFNEQISIYDAAGKLIFSEIVSTSSFEIDLSDFENGLYFITGFHKAISNFFASLHLCCYLISLHFHKKIRRDLSIRF
ncbi:MAG: DUF4465 domain-containing protein [Crocinitomicaceae bacterium]|nr:DUF4465 domain-containing protein [Crocinitomicaceae bacterium]